MRALTGKTLYTHRDLVLQVYPELTDVVDSVHMYITSTDCKGCARNKYTKDILIALMSLEYDGRDLSPLDKVLSVHGIEALKNPRVITAVPQAVRRQSLRPPTLLSQEDNTMDAKTAGQEIEQGRASITWAVFQFPEDAKLIALQAIKPDNRTALTDFLTSLDADDPYELREMPAIGGKKQYVVMGKDKHLPFMEDGVTKKQGEDELGRSIAREQLTIYGEKYPWTKPLIAAGLAKASKAPCSACVEVRLVEEIAIAVRDREALAGAQEDIVNILAKTAVADIIADDEETKEFVILPSDLDDADPSVWGSREPCPLCTLKHLSQAIVLLNESLTGYPVHRWIAIGHMAEAEAEAPSHDIANRIRVKRLEAMDDLECIPYLTDLLVEIDATLKAE